MKTKHQKYISYWLLAGLVMVFVQVVIGGITRLTDSGLSITEWEVVKGVLPPLNEESWNEAFEKYQTYAKKQFEQLHADMTLTEFKVIYFWEWFHRLWARLMGIVFIVPFTFFLARKLLEKWMIKRLLVVVGLAALAATFGWIMVASGLDKDNRTWVSAYKLVIHLSIATALFGYLFQTYLLALERPPASLHQSNNLASWPRFFAILVFVQIVLGGLMAGMRAGAVHTYWPFFLGDNFLFKAITSSAEALDPDAIINYEGSLKVKALVQVFHRLIALLIVFLASIKGIQVFRNKQAKPIRSAFTLLLMILGVQYLLGVLTITGIIGNNIPVFLGVAHQGVALLLFASCLYLIYKVRLEQKNSSPTA